MTPTEVGIPNRSGTISSAFIEAQTSWEARPSRPGKERAWTAERKAAKDTNERMLTTKMRR
jgi:hypothetical protein